MITEVKLRCARLVSEQVTIWAIACFFFSEATVGTFFHSTKILYRLSTYLRMVLVPSYLRIIYKGILQFCSYSLPKSSPVHNIVFPIPSFSFHLLKSTFPKLWKLSLFVPLSLSLFLTLVHFSGRHHYLLIQYVNASDEREKGNREREGLTLIERQKTKEERERE